MTPHWFRKWMIYPNKCSDLNRHLFIESPIGCLHEASHIQRGTMNSNAIFLPSNLRWALADVTYQSQPMCTRVWVQALKITIVQSPSISRLTIGYHGTLIGFQFMRGQEKLIAILTHICVLSDLSPTSTSLYWLLYWECCIVDRLVMRCINITYICLVVHWFHLF